MTDANTPPSSTETADHATFPLRKPLEAADNSGSSPNHGSRWSFRMRPDQDDQPQDWWFASTAIPLLAATIGPLANVMSIAALITSWRANYETGYIGKDQYTIGIPDPHWCIGLNAASLVCGFVGNIFLLFNFTRRIRCVYYIIALPMTIILWYIATGILTAILIFTHKCIPPKSPEQTYSQGFWHAIIAAVLYFVSSMMLMGNMLGYFLGHYHSHFELTDEQRNLILQTMMFFIWLAGGAGVFAKVEGWLYADALYFCDVTILTVGFGDIHPQNDVGRGLVFPYSVGGIIILGLMVSSIHKFAQELGHDNIVKTHVEKRRVQTIGRSVTTSLELEQRRMEIAHYPEFKHRPKISAPFNAKAREVSFDEKTSKEPKHAPKNIKRTGTIASGMRALKRVRSRRTKLLILREEKDRFTAMRDIQHSTKTFKNYYALTLSVIAFGVLWCVGAIGFWKAEAKTQGLSYFQALYFCYVSLLTIGYGDLSPTSNAGKPFFIVWSLVAVPTMTILISDMGDTVIASFKRGTFTLADWTVLPKAGIWRTFLEKHPWLLRWLQNKANKAAESKRLAEGFPTGPLEEDQPRLPPTLEEVAGLGDLDEHALARKLAIAIRQTAGDLKAEHHLHYSYEEWVEYTRLIRFSRLSRAELDEEEEEQGLIEWDWIGENSPMLAQECESEWLLNRLCESLDRYMRKLDPGRGGRGGVKGRDGDQDQGNSPAEEIKKDD